MNAAPTHEGVAGAQAQPNIALIKYWGKRQAEHNLPSVGSLSITLDSIYTRTRVAFDNRLTSDHFTLNGIADPAQLTRVSASLDLLRGRAQVRTRARVDSCNNFPTGAGLASSASGFAALVTAASAALGLDLTDAERSAVARECSGSAARSIFGGFVEWSRGTRDDGIDSIAHQLLGEGDWPLKVIIAITSISQKVVGSTDGMNLTSRTSPYQGAWIDGQEDDLAEARAAVLARDFERLANISEHSCLKMHALAMAARPGLLYWNGATVDGMHIIRTLRRQGVPVFFTVDAGPQIKAICLPEAMATVRAALQEIVGVLDVTTSTLGRGARLIDPVQIAA